MEVTGKQITTQKKTVVLLGCPGFSPTWKDQARCRFRRVENGVSSILIHGTPRGIEAQDCPRVLPYAMKLSLVQSTNVSKCSLNGRLWIISISSCRVISMSFLVLFGGSGQGNSWRYKDGPHLFLDTDEPPCCEDTLICVCVCVCVSVCAQLLSRARLLYPHGLQPTRLLCPWNFPGKNTEAHCHFLLQ